MYVRRVLREERSTAFRFSSPRSTQASPPTDVEAYMSETPFWPSTASICVMPNTRRPSPFSPNRYCVRTPLFLQSSERVCRSSQSGQIEFEVVYVAPEVDSDDENVEYEDDNGHRYRLYLDELENNTAPPSGNSAAASLQGTLAIVLLTANAPPPRAASFLNKFSLFG